MRSVSDEFSSSTFYNYSNKQGTIHWKLLLCVGPYYTLLNTNSLLSNVIKVNLLLSILMVLLPCIYSAKMDGFISQLSDVHASFSMGRVWNSIVESFTMYHRLSPWNNSFLNPKVNCPFSKKVMVIEQSGTLLPNDSRVQDVFKISIGILCCLTVLIYCLLGGRRLQLMIVVNNIKLSIRPIV